MERGLLTPLKELRRQVFVEVARMAFETETENLKDAVEEIPYKITPATSPNTARASGGSARSARSACALRWGFRSAPKTCPCT